MPCWRWRAHGSCVVDAWRKTPTSEEYLADPVAFWVVKLLDLAYVVPIVVGVGIGLLHGLASEDLEDPQFAGLLARAISGRGAFRRFKDTLAERRDLMTQWCD